MKSNAQNPSSHSSVTALLSDARARYRSLPQPVTPGLWAEETYGEGLPPLEPRRAALSKGTVVRSVSDGRRAGSQKHEKKRTFIKLPYLMVRMAENRRFAKRVFFLAEIWGGRHFSQTFHA
jgi:hypothetical protein